MQLSNLYILYIYKIQEEDRTMGIIGQSNAMHNRFAMGGGFMPPARTPMARPMMSGPIFVMGGFEQPSHCHCGEKAALWGGLIGGGLGILAGLFGRKQQAVQYAPGYGGGYSGGGIQQPLTSAQQLTNLKTLYGDKGYAIVDNGDGTFSATKGGNNIGRGSYEDMQKLLGESNDKTNNSTTAKDGTGSIEGKGGDPKKVDTTNTTTVNEDDKKDKDKVDDDKKTGDTAKKDSTTKTDDKSKTGETVTTDDDSSTKPTDGGSKAKGSGSASRAKGTKGTKGTSGNKGTKATNKTDSSQSIWRPTWNKNIYYDEKTKTHYELKNGKWIDRKDIKQANKDGTYYDQQGNLRNAQGKIIKPKKQAAPTTPKQHTEQADNTRVVRPPHFSNIKRH